MVSLLRAQMCVSIQFLIGLRSVQIVLLLFGWYNKHYWVRCSSLCGLLIRLFVSHFAYLCVESIYVCWSILPFSTHSCMFDLEIGATQFSVRNFSTLPSNSTSHWFSALLFLHTVLSVPQLALSFFLLHVLITLICFFLFWKFSFAIRTWLLCHSITSSNELLLLFMWFQWMIAQNFHLRHIGLLRLNWCDARERARPTPRRLLICITHEQRQCTHQFNLIR